MIDEPCRKGTGTAKQPSIGAVASRQQLDKLILVLQLYEQRTCVEAVCDGI